MTKRRRVLQILNLYRLLPAYFIVHIQPEETKSLIIDELEYWNKCEQINENAHFSMFSIMLLEFKEYRNLLVYRLRGGCCEYC